MANAVDEKRSKIDDRVSDEPAVGAVPADKTIQGPVFGRTNYILFAVALAVIVAGFVTLGQGSITAAPILLVVGYLILVPVAILKRPSPGSVPDISGSDKIRGE